MKVVLSINKFYTFLLLFLPSLIAISWLNVYIGNSHYSASNYMLTFVLPAIVFAYAVSLITADRLHEGYTFTFQRVLFTLVALIGSLFLFSYTLTFFGFNSHFLTAYIPSVTDYDKIAVLGTTTEQTDPRETANKFYSIQLAISVVLTILFYAIASFLFKTKAEFIGQIHKTVVLGKGKAVKRGKKGKARRKTKSSRT